MSVQGESLPRRWTARRIAIIALVIVVLGYVLWVVLPFLLAYEEIYVYSYYWVRNDRGEIRQLIVYVGNNGTRNAVLKEVWIGGFRVNNESWGCWYSNTLESSSFEEVYVAPKNFSFQTDQDYNLTMVTSQRQYSFMLNVNENNTVTEKLEITVINFYHWPFIGEGDPIIGISFKNLGASDIIVQKVWINGAFYKTLQRNWAFHSQMPGTVEVLYPWEEGETYAITIETEAGSTATTTVIAD